MRPSLAESLTLETLGRAWDDVRRTDTTPGGVDPAALLRAVRSGAWRPRPCFERTRRKEGGGVRRIRVPRAPDRVLQLAVHRVVGPWMDALFRPEVHGFRRGRSPRTAVAHLVRQAGRRARCDLVQVDVASLFDRLEHGRLRDAVRAAWDDPWWVALVEAWVAAWPLEHGRGIPQGAPLSPLLANLYLHRHLDPALAGLGVPWIRYADDVTLVAPSGGAPGLLRAVDGLVRAAGLELAPAKVRLAVGGSALADAVVLGEPVRADRGVVRDPAPWWLRARLPWLR